MKKKKNLIMGITLGILVIIATIFGGNIKLGDGVINTSFFTENTGNNNDNYIEVVPSKKDDKTEEPSVYVQYDPAMEEEITKLIDDMTVEEKVGQMFFIKNDRRFSESIIDDYPIGGMILFASDFRGETKDSITNKIQAYQDKSKYPLLIGVDEEGGTVTRISQNRALSNKTFQSPRQIYANGGMDAIKEDTIEKSQLLLSLGVNVNFAPVADVTTSSSQYMYQRSFGSDATEAAEYISLVVSIMNEEGVGSVIKHFPGYGGNGDTHKNVIRDKRKYEEFEEVDFLPFEAGIQAGGQCVLISHNIVECMDPDNPASISPAVHEILRNELGFDGVVITDDLMMDGVSDYVSAEDSAVQSILAGNDMILSTDYKIQYRAVLTAIDNGIIEEERLDESVRRILRWKMLMGIM